MLKEMSKEKLVGMFYGGVWIGGLDERMKEGV